MSFLIKIPLSLTCILTLAACGGGSSVAPAQQSSSTAVVNSQTASQPTSRSATVVPDSAVKAGAAQPTSTPTDKPGEDKPAAADEAAGREEKAVEAAGVEAVAGEDEVEAPEQNQVETSASTLPASAYYDGRIRLSKYILPIPLVTVNAFDEVPAQAMIMDGAAFIVSETDLALFVADFAEDTPTLNMTHFNLCRKYDYSARGTPCLTKSELFLQGWRPTQTSVEQIAVGADRELKASILIDYHGSVGKARPVADAGRPGGSNNPHGNQEISGYFNLSPVPLAALAGTGTTTGAAEAGQGLSPLVGNYARTLSQSTGWFSSSIEHVLNVSITDSGRITGYYTSDDTTLADALTRCDFSAQAEAITPVKNLFHVRSFINQCNTDAAPSDALTGLAYLRPQAKGSELVLAVASADNAYYFRVSRSISEQLALPLSTTGS